MTTVKVTSGSGSGSGGPFTLSQNHRQRRLLYKTLQMLGQAHLLFPATLRTGVDSGVGRPAPCATCDNALVHFLTIVFMKVTRLEKKYRAVCFWKVVRNPYKKLKFVILAGSRALQLVPLRQVLQKNFSGLKAYHTESLVCFQSDVFSAYVPCLAHKYTFPVT